MANAVDVPSSGETHQPGRLGYLPALDGLRGVAVAAVLLFHADLAFVRGGHLGVSVFFTLSGFLITSLLLVERRRTGRIDLKAFWGRRARRLVPAMLLTLPLVAVVLHMTDEALPSGTLADGIASMAWVANWHFILEQQTYADLFSLPSPFQHFWSLAVEEQFYVVFPLLFLLVGGRQGWLRRRRLAVVLLALVVISTVLAAVLQARGGGLSRAYYGTDTRGAELLVGALLALLLTGARGPRELTGTARRVLGAAGLVALAGLGAAFALVAKGDVLLYRGGFLLIALATATVIAAAVQPRTVVSRLLANTPTVELGRMSYGVYLYHWPIFLLLTERFTGVDGVQLLFVRVATTVGVAYVSFVAFEQPIRHGYVPLGQGLAAWAGTATAGLVAIAMVTGQLVLPSPTPRATTAAGPAVAPTGTGTAAPQAASRQRVARPGRSTAGIGPARAGEPLTMQPQGSSSLRIKRKRQAVPTELAADPKQSKVPPVPEAKPGQLKIAVVGDSIGHNLGDAFRVWASERTDVVAYNLAIPACPISRGGERRISEDTPFPVDAVCAWWDDPSNERRRALEQFDPDVVVVEDGINEVFDRKLPSWDRWRGPGDPTFDGWLGDELAAATEQWTSGGASILMTNTPCGDWNRYEHFSGLPDAPLRVRQLNLNVYDVMPRVHRADLFNRICPGGQYSDTVEGYEDGRPDGFHFSPEAGAALVRNWLGPLAVKAATQPPPPLLRAG